MKQFIDGPLPENLWFQRKEKSLWRARAISNRCEDYFQALYLTF